MTQTKNSDSIQKSNKNSTLIIYSNQAWLENLSLRTTASIITHFLPSFPLNYGGRQHLRSAGEEQLKAARIPAPILDLGLDCATMGRLNMVNAVQPKRAAIVGHLTVPALSLRLGREQLVPYLDRERAALGGASWA